MSPPHTATLVVALLSAMAATYAAPIDSPVRIDFPAQYGVLDGAFLAPQAAYDAGAYGAHADFGVGAGFASAAPHKGGFVGNLIAQRAHAAAAAAAVPQLHTKAGIFSAPVTKLESAVLQTEGFESKPLTIKENLQNIVAGIFQPKPIVDTISEVEKYGNTGDKFSVAGRAIVGGAEGISNLVNTVLEVPGAIIKKITRTASEKLNNLGGRLIGLV